MEYEAESKIHNESAQENGLSLSTDDNANYSINDNFDIEIVKMNDNPSRNHNSKGEFPNNGSQGPSTYLDSNHQKRQMTQSMAQFRQDSAHNPWNSGMISSFHSTIREKK